MNRNISIALHGGAGTITRSSLSPEMEGEYKFVLKQALDLGYNALNSGKSSLDAVEMVVSLLEDSHLFNAGRGSVFTHEGKHEMDASIMDGSNKKAGAVAGISGIKNPVQLARKVMDKSDHVLLAGEGALVFAKTEGFPLMAASYFYDDLRFKQLQESLLSNKMQLDHSPLDDKKFGTVGAVALDKNGNLAAATSTGGMTNKKYGRIGDSPLIGSGTYANNETCAVSCTGSGEFFIRSVVAYDVSCLMEYKNMSLEEACNEVINNRLLKIGGDGGLIAVDRNGNVSMPFNTEGMYRACKTEVGPEIIEIYK